MATAPLDNVIYLGINGKMSEPSAAMGLTSLESIDVFIEHHRQNYAAYRNGLRDIVGCVQLEYSDGECHNYQYIVLEVDEVQFGISRDHLVKLLHAENVRARRYFYPGIHRMEPYRNYYPNAGLLLPETERLVDRTLCLPTGTAVSPSEVEFLCALIRFTEENADAICRHPLDVTPENSGCDSRI